MREIDDVIDEHSGRSRRVLEYAQVTKRVVDGAKVPDFSAAAWAPLAALVDTENFVRVGNFKEVMDWAQYVEFLTAWAAASSWEGSFKRITEHDGRVFLELEERSEIGDYRSVVNSMSVYEFDDTDRIRRIDLYLQMALPSGDMLGSYDGVQIGE